MKRGALLSFALFCLTLAGCFSLPQEMQAAAAAALSLVSGLALLAWDGASALRRRHRVRTNPLDPVLRSLVASETSWENASLLPDLSASALVFLGFLVTERGFSPATVSPDGRRFVFRKDDFEIVAAPSRAGSASSFSLLLYHPAHRSRVLVRQVYASAHVSDLAPGAEGIAAYLRTHLDTMEMELRREAALDTRV